MGAERVFTAWLQTKRAMSMLAPALKRRRGRLWRDLQPALSRTPALAGFHGMALAEYPITEPNELRADYGKWNSVGKTDADLRALADASENGAATGDLTAGWSSGSTGNTRGLFIANSHERADYLGQSLARLLPAGALFKRQRLALHLRANNALYSDVERGRLAFAHFPLEGNASETMTALAAFEPTILIAPPHRLLQFAKSALRLPSLRYLFCGSEPISIAETAYLTEVFGLRPCAIYQATEGFLGAECSDGRLHLNEHTIQFDWEPVPGTSGYRPIITDLRRKSQPIVRLRGDDFVEFDTRPCPCGFGGRVIHAPQGRVYDIWHLKTQIITPPQVVAAIEGVLGGAHDWQAAASRGGVCLRLAPAVPKKLGQEAGQALQDLTEQPVKTTYDLTNWPGPKRRKVVWSDG
jgi:putative adenylate-forming enzyme